MAWNKWSLKGRGQQFWGGVVEGEAEVIEKVSREGSVRAEHMSQSWWKGEGRLHRHLEIGHSRLESCRKSSGDEIGVGENSSRWGSRSNGVQILRSLIDRSNDYFKFSSPLVLFTLNCTCWILAILSAFKGNWSKESFMFMTNFLENAEYLWGSLGHMFLVMSSEWECM